MTDPEVVRSGRDRRTERAADARRARRHRGVRVALLLVAVSVVALLAFMAPLASDPTNPGHTGSADRTAGAAARKQTSGSGYGAVLAPERVRARFQLPMLSGLLFDVRTGRVLWERDPARPLPIASLTKMMTALVVAARSRPTDRVLVTRAAVQFSGSGVGLLPLGKKVSLVTLLYGLLLPSGNDAAIALAQHVAGTQSRFIAMMNAQARSMGLRCTYFTTVSGIVDQGNHSCATDLAIMAHAVLARPLLARIVGTRNAVLPFPVKGGKLWLYNNNPLLRMRYPGADGVKTGYTVAAGPCLVATAKRGRKWLGVVLLHSNDPPDQATKLLDAAFATPGA